MNAPKIINKVVVTALVLALAMNFIHHYCFVAAMKERLDGLYSSFETRPGLASDPGLEPSLVEKKTKEEKTRCDPVDPV